MLKEWRDKFLAKGSVLKSSSNARKGDSETICIALANIPTKSIKRASLEAGIPKSTVHRALHRRLRSYTYKAHIVKPLRSND
ncbi:hypothetical protein NPIL_250231 [Nephila pilipes]|uniref:Uncharacterized protein n=1 Tax=Nephila pilipes TaxID=299642 RepID=A0A8X6TJT6_NEPPI|nr:hypothetical protein NPIL_250231 [Nephila pilipes]